MSIRRSLSPARGMGLLVAALLAHHAVAAPPDAATPAPVQEEWVYRVKWGHEDEFWRLFQKTQVPVLDRQKELGYVLRYEVYRPGLHTSEDSRWTYRVIITYRDLLATTHEAELEKQLFPDRAAYRQAENQRWSLVDAHYDLPIEAFDPHATE